MMETVDVSLSGGCGAIGNSQKVKLQPSAFLNCYLRGVGGGEEAVGRGRLHLLTNAALPYDPPRREPSRLGRVLFLSFITVANQKLAVLQCPLKAFLSSGVLEVEMQCQK